MMVNGGEWWLMLVNDVDDGRSMDYHGITMGYNG